MSNSNKNMIFVEASVMNISTKFQLHLPWQAIKYSCLDKIHSRGLLQEHLCKFFVKMSAVG